MNSFKDFINEKKGISTLVPLKETKTKIFNIINTSSKKLSNFEIENFSNNVLNIAYEDKTISELSDKIGKPEQNESEEEFVQRAKNELKKLLKNKLL